MRGKLTEDDYVVHLHWDHPRRCGENHTTLRTAGCRTGSPPQVRGKLIFVPPFLKLDRITPAGAGKTSPIERTNGDAGDHPRRCGENFIVLLAEQAEMGSPPQVRGKPRRLQPLRQMRRITPAGAGKTRFFSNFTSPVKDHPRRCGENGVVEGLIAAIPRITPAGAGKTCQCAE